MSVKVILSDLGGVLIDYSFDLAIAEWARLANVSSDVLRERLVVDEAWQQFEVDRLTEAEFCCHLRELYGLSLTDDQLIRGWNAIYIGVNADVERLLRGTAAHGSRVVAVTNTNVSHQRVWQDRFAEALGFFGAIYSSWEVGARKPEPTFFEHVLESEQVPPQETLFVDDQAVNVDAAARLGIDAVLYTGAASLRGALASRRLLGSSR